METVVKQNGTSVVPMEMFDDPNSMIAYPKTIVKRDGRVVSFDITRIENAVAKCFDRLDAGAKVSAERIAHQAANVVAAKYDEPTVEQVQDIVEMVLQAAGEYEAAKSYILYRAEHAKLREVRPVPDEVRDAFAESDPFFPTQLQKFQFYDKYSRFNYDKGRRETWVETVDRAVMYLREISNGKLDGDEYGRLREGILNMKVMPSMRLLAMAGPAARRNNIALYNCSYMAVDSIDAFVEALIISMCGCGVGFSVERQYVEQFARITRQSGAPATTYVVEDSSEGWADAVRVGLTTWFDGEDIKFDYSQVRAAGIPLKIKGGRASGPEPLRKMLDFARGLILARQGSFLRPLDAHDIMCAIGNAAVSGGVRRTAMISLFDPDDKEMLECKNGNNLIGNEHRWNANNSAVWTREYDQTEMADFVLEMVKGGRGEPGIFSRVSAQATLPERRITEGVQFGTNPCVTADTWVAVADGRGRVRMGELVAEGRDVDVFTVKDGELAIRTMRNPRKTGTDTPIYRVAFADGTFMRVTQNHKFVLKDGTVKQAIELSPNDALVSMKQTVCTEQALPRMIRFGEQHEQESAIIKQHQTNNEHAGVTYSSELPIKLIDGAAYVSRMCEQCGTEFSVPYNHREQAYCGCTFSDVAPLKTLPSNNDLRSNQVTIYNDLMFDLNRHPLEAEWQERCRAVGISPEVSRVSSPFRNWNRLQEAATAENHRVVSVELEGHEDVYTGTVDDTHTYFAIGNEGSDTKDRAEMRYVLNVQCGEILLRSQQFCNLTSVVCRADDTLETLKDKVEMATILGTLQSMATHFPGLRPQWKQNCQEERLLGVDLNGQLDSIAAQDPEVQVILRDHAVATNKKYAEMLGINQSVSVTCTKPSGNSSTLVNSSSGIHARWADHYIRNVRVGAHSPLLKVMKDAGVPMNPENGQTAENADTWVISFPVKSPENAITRNTKGAIEQCNYWLSVKENYTEHNPSVTITYRPNEVLDLLRWIYDHQTMIGGMAFLPAFDAQYDQMPYIEITEAEYDKLAGAFPNIDFSKIYRYEESDLTTAAQEFACLAGNCDV